MMTKALKTRLQKLIDAVPDAQFQDLWTEFGGRMTQKEQQITAKFHIGDEVEWKHKKQIKSGTIRKVNQTTCSIIENNTLQSKWRVAGGMLIKSETLRA